MGRSHWLDCHCQLKALDLVALFSWLLCLAACRYCGKRCFSGLRPEAFRLQLGIVGRYSQGQARLAIARSKLGPPLRHVSVRMTAIVTQDRPCKGCSALRAPIWVTGAIWGTRASIEPCT